MLRARGTISGTGQPPKGARESSRAPGLKAAIEISGTREAKLLQSCGRETRLIALVAHEDDLVPQAWSAGVAVLAVRGQAPFQNVARDDDRVRDPPSRRICESDRISISVAPHRTLC